MKSSLTNPVKYNRIATIEAIFVTILIHVLFLLLFSIGNSSESSQNIEESSIRILNFNNLNANDREELNYILTNNNPTLMTRGNSPYGFEAMLSKQEDTKFDNTALSNQAQDKYVIKYDDIQFDEPKAITLSKNKNEINNLQGFTAIKNSKFQQAYPYAIDGNGRVFDLKMKDNQTQVDDNYLLKASVIKITKDDDNIYRINIIQSSGRRDFDLLAAQSIQNELIKNRNQDKEMIFTVYYNEEIE